MSKRIIPVTVLCGYLGSGKTTLLNHILHSEHGYKIGVIVNDMSEVNIDAQLIEQGGFSRTGEELVRMQNGCVCCTLRQDLLRELDKLADLESIDYIVMEASGISDPIPIAQTFLYTEDAENIDLSEKVRLDTMVTVVDADRFWSEFAAGNTLLERKEEYDKEREEHPEIADLIINQIEFCNVVILNKCDLLNEKQIYEIERILRVLQQDAKIVRSVKGVIEPGAILGTEFYNFEKVSNSAGWLKELEKAEKEEAHHHEYHHEHESSCECGSECGCKNHHHHHHEDNKYGITTFVYKRKVPFEAQRFYEWITGRFPASVVRAKGFARIAQHDEFAVLVEQAGKSVDIQPVGYWNPQYKETQLVFIGMNLEKEMIIEALDACLLVKEEMGKNWKELPTPFKWKTRK